MRAPALEAVNGAVKLAYEVRGSGPPLLLVQGLGYGRWGWEPVLDPLAEDFRIALYDNRGIGESDIPPGPYTTAQLAEDADAVDVSLVEDRRAHHGMQSVGAGDVVALALPQDGRLGHGRIDPVLGELEQEAPVSTSPPKDRIALAALRQIQIVLTFRHRWEQFCPFPCHG